MNTITDTISPLSKYTNLHVYLDAQTGSFTYRLEEVDDPALCGTPHTGFTTFEKAYQAGLIDYNTVRLF